MSSRTWLLLLLIITVAVRLPTMFGVKRTGWDERAYVVFAQTLDKGGVSGIRQWMHDYPTNESLQKSPLLLRVGFIVPAMFTCKILGGFNADNLAWLSSVAVAGPAVGRGAIDLSLNPNRHLRRHRQLRRHLPHLRVAPTEARLHRPL